MSRLISTHIRGRGYAVFQQREQALELQRHADEDAAVGRSWINRMNLVVEGLASQPYIHMDIRTPFGETVNEGQVEEALAERLGPRKEVLRKGGWHIQYVEDTNLGSNHRVFADLRTDREDGEDGDEASGGLPGMDCRLPLEPAVEALGDLVLAEKGEPSFQLLCGSDGFCYSLLYSNGAPFHLLRVPDSAGPKAAGRLVRHREFLLGGKNGGLPVYLCPGDSLAKLDAIAALHPEIVDLGLRAAVNGKQPGDASLYFHLGLAHAARQKDLGVHNRVPEAGRRRNAAIRTRHRFVLAASLTAVACLAAALAYAGVIRNLRGQLDTLQSQASAYQAQVKAIKDLRRRKASLEDSLGSLRPLWAEPMDWSRVFARLTEALPREAGLEGLQVTRKGDGDLELSFRAWVKDWNQVQAIQRRLSQSPHFVSVAIPEQRKDLASGVVVFHVTCVLARK